MISHSMERRGSERSKVMLSVAVEGSEALGEARLANVSTNGACLIGASLGEGSTVLLQRNGMSMPGRVSWSAGQQSGICFAQPLNPQSVLRPIATPRERVSFPSKRPGLKCQPLSKADMALLERSATAGRCLVR